MYIKQGIDEIQEFIDEILINKYFNYNEFREEIKRLVSYKEEILLNGKIKIIQNKGSMNEINEFLNIILYEVYLKVLVRLRSSILNNKIVIEEIKSNTKVKNLFNKIFTFNDNEIIDIINNCCEKDIIEVFIEECGEQYENEILENYYFRDNFHKDNAILKLLALNINGKVIVNKAFGEDSDPKYEIELKYKNNYIYNAKSMDNARLNKFKKFYNTLKVLCENEILVNNKNINKWLSIYEANEVSGCINILAIGETRKWIRYISKEMESIKEVKVINDDNAEKEDHEMKVKRKLLENKVIIVDYFLENKPIFNKLLDNQEIEYYEILKNIFNIIDISAEKIVNFINSYKSIDLILEIILTINSKLAEIECIHLFDADIYDDFYKYAKGKEIVDMYNMYFNL